MLIRFLSSIRKKPKEVRDQYAFWIATLFTCLIAVPWLFGIPGQLTSDRPDKESEPVFSSFFGEAADRLSEATEGIDGLRDVETSTTATSSGTSTIEVDMDSVESVSDSAASEIIPITSAPRAVRIATTTTSTAQ